MLLIIAVMLGPVSVLLYTSIAYNRSWALWRFVFAIYLFVCRPLAATALICLTTLSARATLVP
jgi:hypothetical protein